MVTSHSAPVTAVKRRLPLGSSLTRSGLHGCYQISADDPGFAVRGQKDSGAPPTPTNSSHSSPVTPAHRSRRKDGHLPELMTIERLAHQVVRLAATPAGCARNWSNDIAAVIRPCTHLAAGRTRPAPAADQAPRACAPPPDHGGGALCHARLAGIINSLWVHHHQRRNCRWASVQPVHGCRAPRSGAPTRDALTSSRT